MPAKPPLAKRRTSLKPKTKRSSSTKVDAPPAIPRSPPVPPSVALEQCIARILHLRYRQDIARLYSQRLHNICQRVLPGIVLDCSLVSSPGWVAYNAADPEIRQFFRSAIAMDLRQSGERVATKSVLWSYTSIRQFAMSHEVSICENLGLDSLKLLPHVSGLQAHLELLESLPVPTFTKPHHVGPLSLGWKILERQLSITYRGIHPKAPVKTCWASYNKKARQGYDLLVDTLWEVANEFKIDGYGLVLKNKLENSWCYCGCSSSHLAEVCEHTVREDEAESKRKAGKAREWDGRGHGIKGWETENEEDVWDLHAEVGAYDDRYQNEANMTIPQIVEMRYIRAERAKEAGNTHFKKGNFKLAIESYETAVNMEPELPLYKLNLAAAHLKLSQWIEAEKTCTAALQQHHSEKGLWRRAKALKELGRVALAIEDLKALLKLQPSNAEALAELELLTPPDPRWPEATSSAATASHHGEGSSSAAQQPGASSSRQGNMPNDPGVANRSKYPYEVHEADTHKLKIRSTLRTMQPLDTKQFESYLYPNWDNYNVVKA